MPNRIDNPMKLATARLDLVLQSPAEMLVWAESLPQEVRCELSETWLSQLRHASQPDLWLCLFKISSNSSGQFIGMCGFKGPPDEVKAVEITYGIEPQYLRRGYATESVCALIDFSRSHPQVNRLRAHSNKENKASEGVLVKAGLRLIGEIEDQEDGLVNRWELSVEN